MHMSKPLKVAVGTVVLIAVGGLAYAFWTGSGSGSGSGSVGNGGSVVLTGTVTPGIAPGTSSAVTFTAANPGASAVQVSTVHLESVAVDAGHSGCLTSDFSMSNVAQNHQVPAGAIAEALPNDGTLQFEDTAVNQDACKGATLTLTLSST
jgi:hypothetical protein